MEEHRRASASSFVKLARSRASATGSPSRPLRRLWLRTAVIVTRPLASVQEHHGEDEELGGRGEPGYPRSALRRSARIFRVQFLQAVRADAVAELRLRMLADIHLDFIPIAVVVAHLLARRADRQQPAQHFDLPEGVLKFTKQAVSLLLRLSQGSHVSGEGAGMDEFAVLPEHVGINQHMLDPAVLAPKPGLVTLQGLPACEAFEHLLGEIFVDMELGHMMPDILLARAAEQVQLGLVCPQDASVRARPVQGFDRIFEEIGQLLIFTAQRRVRPLSQQNQASDPPDHRPPEHPVGERDRRINPRGSVREPKHEQDRVPRGEPKRQVPLSHPEAEQQQNEVGRPHHHAKRQRQVCDEHSGAQRGDHHDHPDSGLVRARHRWTLLSICTQAQSIANPTYGVHLIVHRKCGPSRTRGISCLACRLSVSCFSMNGDVKTSRSQLVQITPLPQLVPSRVCLSCDVCCRFPEPNSPLRPYFTAEEIRRAIAMGVAPAQFTDLDGCQVSVVPSHVSDGYLCPAFDPITAHCRIYDVRPLDCQIYPLMVMWNADRTQVVLGWDSKCPFLREGKGDEAGVAAYAGRIAGLLEQEDTLETFAKNPQLIGHFQDDVGLLRPLPRLTERVKVMRDESSVTGEPQSPPSTQHLALSTQHFSSLTLADRPRFERAFASVETPLAAYAFASHFVWRALFSYSWAELDGHLSLFAEYADGVYMPLPPLPLPTGVRQDASPWPMTPRPSPVALAACFAFMRARNGGAGGGRSEKVAPEHQAPPPALGCFVVPKDSEYPYRSRRLAE